MKTTTTHTTLVLSFSGVLNALYEGLITAHDLEGAMFYFGCTRDHVLLDGVGGSQGEMQHAHQKDPVEVNAAYSVVREAVLASEEAGKVAWRELYESPSWEQLNELLSSNDLPVISSDGSSERSYLGAGRLYRSQYSYQGVIEAVEQQGLPYRVIWNR